MIAPFVGMEIATGFLETQSWMWCWTDSVVVIDFYGQIFLARCDGVFGNPTTLSQENLAANHAEPRKFGDQSRRAKNIWRPITPSQTYVATNHAEPKIFGDQSRRAKNIWRPIILNQSSQSKTLGGLPTHPPHPPLLAKGPLLKQLVVVLNDLSWKDLHHFGLHK